MGKVICEECGTSFLYSVVKDLQTCPVCGKPLWEGVENVYNSDVGSNADENENSSMYFDEIDTSYVECPELNGVSAYCGECNAFNTLELDKFDKLLDKEYVILKEGVTVKCRGCGKEHKPRKILYKKKEQYKAFIPRCPVCNSAMLKKIKTSSKVLAAATLGALALPYNSKTYECQNCNYRF